MQDCVQSARFDQKCLAGAVGAPCWLSPSPAPPPGHGPPCPAWLPHLPPLLMQYPQREEEAAGASAGWEAYCWVPVCGTSCSTPGSLCRHCGPGPTATKSPVWPATGTGGGSTQFLVAVQWAGTSVALLWLPEAGCMATPAGCGEMAAGCLPILQEEGGSCGSDPEVRVGVESRELSFHVPGIFGSSP